MNWKVFHTPLFIVLLLSSLSLSGLYSTVLAQSDSVSDSQLYAFLLDQFVNNSESLIPPSAPKLESALDALGWNNSHITTLYGEDEFTFSNMLSILRDFQQVIDSDDLFFIYIVSDGYLLYYEILLQDWFHTEMQLFSTDNIIILLDCSYAGGFITPFSQDQGFYQSSVNVDEFSVAMVAEDASNWTYTEPYFSGHIPSHFWISRLNDTSADTSGEGVITMQELFDHTTPLIQSMYTQIFHANPEWTEENFGITDPDNVIYPTPLVFNNHDFELSLNASSFLQDAEEENVPDNFPVQLVVAMSVVGVFITGLIIFFSKRKKKDVFA